MFDKSTGAYRHKNETAVKLHLSGSGSVTGVVFHVNGERLSDLMNDPRAFLPVKMEGGETLIIAKTQIISILEIEQTEKTDGDDDAAEAKTRSFDPYDMLRISPDASDEEVRAAYKARIKAVHPDTIASLGLDEDLTKASLLTTQKINYAYRKIKQTREAKRASDEENAA